MSEECNAPGFIKLALAAWIGSSIAFGSCGSCNLTDVVGNRTDKRIEQLETRLVGEIEKVKQETTNYLVPGQTYMIGGQEYHLVPVEQSR